MEMYGCTHTNAEECDRSRQCYQNGAHSHSSINIDAHLSTQRIWRGALDWSAICKGLIYIIAIFKWITNIIPVS
jgi:hypothetical protein